ncbi:MAG: hypothetical protein CMG13_00190 [Candidatus Marinimicrobia bacterium]|nr:hypothetical protein [Candidatus Neomarinimicrobiota bacterium]|tara:strand:- start:276 stop:1154 length:879 start_codon:yes stop_codon:yes gene_type:complete
MIKLIIHIALFSCLLADLPNDVRWVQDSEEYRQICKSTFNSAYNKIKKIINQKEYKSLSYSAVRSAIDNQNSMNILNMVCSKNKCLGSYGDDGQDFQIEFKSISNSFIQSIKRSHIDYRYVKNIEKYISKNSNHAIIVDLDETILDNSEYQVILNKEGKKFNQKSWSNWVKKEEAKLVPGAKKFIKRMRNLGIQIIFISNRMDSNLLPTINNLKNLNIFSKKDIYLLRLDKADRKTVRRKEVFTQSGRMKNYPRFNVVAFLGDAYGDFPKNNDNYSWNLHYHIFPNPMYGKW